MSPRFRNAVLQVHRWTGITIGLLLVFLAVTGIGMLFRPQIEPVVEQRLLVANGCTSRVALDTLVANARGAHPGKSIEEIEIASTRGASIMVRFEGRYDVFMHPCSGGVIAGRSHWGGFFGTVEQLHRFRFLDNWTGDVVGGTAAAIMVMVFAVGGLVVWWPASRRAAKSAFKLKWRLRGRAFELNLHRTTGIYVCLVLLTVGSSALPLAFKPVRNWIYSVVGSPMPAPKPKSVKPPLGTPPAALEEALRRAHTMVGAAKTFVVPPREDTDAVEIFMIAADAPHPNARTYAWFDAFSGTLLRFEPYEATSRGSKAHRWLSSLHMGYLGGMGGQLLLLLGVLGVPVLAYTGISSYVRKRSAHLKARSAALKGGFRGTV